MSPEIHGKNLSVKISLETLEILDALAQRADISRSKLVHNILESTIDEMDMGRKIGFFQMAILIRNFNEKLSGPSAKKGKPDPQEEKTIPVRISAEYQQKLETLAKLADRTPHYLMKNFVQLGAEELNTKVVKNIIPLAILIRDLKTKINSLCEKGEKAMNSYSSDVK
jgi:predicted DNA-binding protein